MKKPPLDVQAASRVASFITLAEVQFLHLSIAYITQQQESSPSGSLSWDMMPVVANWHRVDLQVLAVLEFGVNIHVLDESDPESRIRIADAAVTLRLEYSLKSDVEVLDDDLDDFVGVSGYMHAWPYLRAEIQSLTTKIGLPPLLLPVQLSGHAASAVTVVRAADLQAALGDQKSAIKQLLPTAG